MRLLLVEDEVAVARFIRKGLEAERYQVDVVSDGQQALQRLGEETYALIVLDVRLPGASGIEVCRQARQAGVHIPILMLTARDSVEDKVAGLQAGADDYLTKPFAFEELLARLAALLRRHGAVDLAPALQVADLVLDLTTHEVRRSGVLIRLTAKEFSFLDFLMRNAGRVLSRSVIEDRVWGYSHDPSTNVVDVYIRRLRRKVDEDFSRPLLHTIRGVGYVLKA